VPNFAANHGLRPPARSLPRRIWGLLFGALNRGAMLIVKTPGLLLLAVGVVAIVVGLASFAERYVTVGVGAIVVALLASGAGFAWLGMESRRVRQVQRERKSSHRARS
jgi:uncharacterized membrane-anchored protein